MAKMTIKIDESTKIGKVLIALIEALQEESIVEVVKAPNAVTIKAIEDVKKGINVKRVNNSKELFDELGI